MRARLRPATGVLAASVGAGLGWLAWRRPAEERDDLVTSLAWPATAAQFEFPALALPRAHGYAESTRHLRADPRRPTRPCLLISQLREPSADFTRALGKPGSVAVLVAPPGAGKSRALIELAAFSPAYPMYLDCSSRFHLDAYHALDSPDEDLRRVLHARHVVLAEAKRRYGDAFEPRHWLALQLFPEHFLGKDVFLALVLQQRAVAADSFVVRNPVLLDHAELVPDDLIPDVMGVLAARERAVVVASSRQPPWQQHDAPAAMQLRLAHPYASMDETLARLHAWGLVDATPTHAAMFQGRPGHAAALAEESIGAGRLDVQAAALAVVEAHIRHLGALDNAPMAPGTAEPLAEFLRRAALDYTLGGRGGLLPSRDVADTIERTVCQLAVTPELHASCKEPLVLDALTGALSPAAALAVSAADSSALGFAFEAFLARVAPELIALCTDDARLKALDARFQGWGKGSGASSPWLAPAVGLDGRLARRAKSGEEPARVREALRGGVPGIVLPATDMGPDVILVSKHARDDGRRLVVLVQAKASTAVSTSRALLSLSHVYATQRGTKRESVPARFRSAEREWLDLVSRDDVALVRLVVKYPAKSKHGTRHARVEADGSLTVVIDGDSQLLGAPQLQQGLDVLARLKSK